MNHFIILGIFGLGFAELLIIIFLVLLFFGGKKNTSNNARNWARD